MVSLDAIDVERSRFTLGDGVDVAAAVGAGVLLAEPGRGGGCMGVCLDLAAREEAEAGAAAEAAADVEWARVGV